MKTIEHIVHEKRAIVTIMVLIMLVVEWFLIHNRFASMGAIVLTAVVSWMSWWASFEECVNECWEESKKGKVIFRMWKKHAINYVAFLDAVVILLVLGSAIYTHFVLAPSIYWPGIFVMISSVILAVFLCSLLGVYEAKMYTA